MKAEELLELAEKATQGEWKMSSPFDIDCLGCGDVVCESCVVESNDESQTAYIQLCGMENFTRPNAEWIAAAHPEAMVPLLRELITLRKSQRTAELRAMRVLMDWRKRRALLLVTEGASSGEAALCAIGELERMTDDELASLLEEADHNDLA